MKIIIAVLYIFLLKPNDLYATQENILFENDIYKLREKGFFKNKHQELFKDLVLYNKLLLAEQKAQILQAAIYAENIIDLKNSIYKKHTLKKWISIVKKQKSKKITEYIKKTLTTKKWAAKYNMKKLSESKITDKISSSKYFDKEEINSTKLDEIMKKTCRDSSDPNFYIPIKKNKNNGGYISLITSEYYRCLHKNSTALKILLDIELEKKTSYWRVQF